MYRFVKKLFWVIVQQVNVNVYHICIDELHRQLFSFNYNKTWQHSNTNVS